MKKAIKFSLKPGKLIISTAISVLLMLSMMPLNGLNSKEAYAAEMNPGYEIIDIGDGDPLPECQNGYVVSFDCTIGDHDTYVHCVPCNRDYDWDCKL